MTPAAEDENDGVDLEAEGLLDGVTGAARTERRAVLEQLMREGATLSELRRAVREDRLAILPLERELIGPARYSMHDLAQKSGTDVEFLLSARQAAGLPRPDPNVRAFSDRDLEAARIYGRFLTAGLPARRLLEVIGVMGRGLAHAADAIIGLTGEAFLGPQVTEHELMLSNATAAGDLLPLVAPMLDYVLRLHLLDHISSEAFNQTALLSGPGVPDTRAVAVAFADLSGFTRIGEQRSPKDVGRIVSRLEEIANEVVCHPVRLVKTIGDAVMLVCPEPLPLLTCIRRLVRRGEEAASELPPLRAGLASGTALSRSGDWYGRPVNLASRVTAVAPPRAIIATKEVRDATAGAARWTSRGKFELKGLSEMVELFELEDG